MIWAVILAAGESRRMARPKLLLPFGESTIIEKVVAEAVSSRVDNTLIVLGAHRKKILDKVKKFPVTTTVNQYYSQGMLSSVQTGFRALPKGTHAAVILLGDQPSVSRTVIDKVVRTYKKSRKGIVLPTFKKERGHPVLIDLKYIEEIEKLSPEVGLRGIVYSHPEDVCEVPVSDSSILKDIDTIQDYKREMEAQN